MGKTRKVNKAAAAANNLILENDLSLLSGRLYTDINGIVFILGLGLFISLVNCIFLLRAIYLTSVLGPRTLVKQPKLLDLLSTFVVLELRKA